MDSVKTPEQRAKAAAAERERRKRPEVKAAAAARRVDPAYKEQARQRAAEWRDGNRERDRQNARDYAAEHRDEAKQRTANWKAANPEKVVEQQADWYRRNKDRKKARRQENRQRDAMRSARRRALQQTATTIEFTEEQLRARLAYWGDRCWICQLAIATGIDHVKPLSAGGAHMLCNFRPACGPCNSGKSSKWPWPSVVNYVQRRRVAVRRLLGYS